jgi:hypothetical protein
MNQLAQLRRASVEVGLRGDHAQLSASEPIGQMRVGRCVCGAPVAAHYNGRNAFVGCRHAQKVGA